MIELILGGARSGKSGVAEEKIIATGNTYKQVVYIATATVYDKEMAERVKLHQQRRPAHWTLIEEPIKLAKILKKYNHKRTIILVECLSLWLTNLLCDDNSGRLSIEKKKLFKQLQKNRAHIIIVSNETGLGVIPMGELSRRFVDESGLLHQQLATLSDNVSLIVAGLEHRLKQSSSTNYNTSYKKVSHKKGSHQ